MDGGKGVKREVDKSRDNLELLCDKIRNFCTWKEAFLKSSHITISFSIIAQP